jgi:hypothetical protein
MGIMIQSNRNNNTNIKELMIQNYQNNNQIKRNDNTNQRKNNNPKGKARQAKGIKGVYCI